jgi:hypothetical protein
MKKIHLTLFASLLLIGCAKEDSTNFAGDFSNGFFILNEGTFNFGNASLDFYYSNKDSLADNVFQKTNQASLGDVAQSMIRTNKYLIMVVNNSQKIEVLDINTLKRVKTITGFDSPRYIYMLDTARALVTELYNKKVHIVDIEKGVIEQSKEAFGWGEKMISVQNNIWIQIKKHPSEPNGKKGFIIYSPSNGMFSNIEYNDEPISHLFAQNYLWILAKKDDSTSRLIAHDPLTMDLLSTEIKFDKTASPRYLIYDNNQSLFYYEARKIWKVDISNPKVSFTAVTFIDLSHLQNVYNLQFYKQHIFVFDAKNYIQRGIIEQYDVNGNKIKTIQAGIIPHEIQ